jgi:zinc protease
MIPPLALLLGLLQQPAHPGSPALPNGVTRQASAGGITEYRLSNGLTVLTRVDHSGIGTTVTIRYAVGTYDERLGERGIAHLLEHLAFSGTRRHPLLRREIAAHGADVGAVTGEEQTVFATTVPSTEEDIRWAIEVEADRMRGLRLDSRELETQRAIVRNEVRVGAPSLRARIRELAFDVHPYAGSAANADVLRIAIADVRQFYHKHYTPGRRQLRRRHSDPAGRPAFREHSHPPIAGRVAPARTAPIRRAHRHDPRPRSTSADRGVPHSGDVA